MRNINPSVKAIAVMAAAVVSAFSFSVKWNLILIAFCLLMMIISKANLKVLLIVLIPATIAAVSLFAAIAINGGGTGSAEAAGTFFNAAAGAQSTGQALAVGLRIYAYVFMGMLFVLTTDTNGFVYSLMQQCRMSPKFAYGILASVNLMPLIRREMSQIRLAYRIRGYHVSPLSFKPAFSALVNSLNWSESLAMAMESKGFDGEGKRTYYINWKVTAKDIIFAVVLIGIALMGALGIL